MLNREKLIEMSEVDYFGGGNDHNLELMMKPLSKDCVMRFPSAGFRYAGTDALTVHLQDFFSAFKIINFYDFTHVVDVQEQAIVSYFTVELTDHDGVLVSMDNLNIFRCDKDGLFNEIIIYNTKGLDKGFQEGRS